MATLVLSDNEHYILKCIVGHIKYTSSDVASLIDKVFEDEDELGALDYNKVVFTKDTLGDNQIEFKEGEI